MKKEKKSCRIQLRLTPTEKKKIDKIVEKSGLTKTKIIKELVLEEKLGVMEKILQCTEIIVSTLDLVRYMQDHYEEIINTDYILERKVEDLCNKLH